MTAPITITDTRPDVGWLMWLVLLVAIAVPVIVAGLILQWFAWPAALTLVIGGVVALAVNRFIPCAKGTTCILTLAMLVFGAFCPQAFEANGIGLYATAGLLLAASVLSVSKPGSFYADTIALPALYGMGLLWIAQSTPDALKTIHQQLLMAVTIISLLLRITAGWLNVEQGLSIKSLTWWLMGSMCVYAVTHVWLLQFPLDAMALLYAGSIVAGWVVLKLSQSVPEAGAVRWLGLALIGLLTIVASRLFGSIGWLVAGTALLALPVESPSASLALLRWFLPLRILVQLFVVQFVSNITGLNMLHPYVYAGLFAGSLLPVGVYYWAAFYHSLSTLMSRWAVLALTSLVCMLIPYGLHAEAAGSLFLALLLGCVAVVALHNNRAELSVGLVLPVTGWLLCLGLISAPLLESGIEADKPQRLIVLCVASIIITVLFWLGTRHKPEKLPAQTALNAVSE